MSGGLRWTDEEWRRYNAARRLGRDTAAPPSDGRTVAPSTAAKSAPTRGKERSELEQILAGNFAAMELAPIREFHMANIDDTARGWRFDFAFPAERVLVEIHGALGFGKHSKKAGQTNDLQKANAATEHGWSVFSYGAAQIRSGEAALQVERVVRARRLK